MSVHDKPETPKIGEGKVDAGQDALHQSVPNNETGLQQIREVAKAMQGSNTADSVLKPVTFDGGSEKTVASASTTEKSWLSPESLVSKSAEPYKPADTTSFTAANNVISDHLQQLNNFSKVA